MKTSRRGALAIGLGGAAVAVAQPVLAQSQPRSFMVSTWDFGAAANAAAYSRWKATANLLDALEAGAQVTEADASNHSVGLGGYPDRDGHVRLDAIIMDDRGNVGAVAALEDILHPISVARRVMEKTPHTMLVGAGARQFALSQGFETTRLLTPEAEAAWRKWLETAEYKPVANSENQRGSALDHDTIGLLACGPDGALAGACTTSGMAFKLRGRVGDSPQAGCGLFVERGVGAATATGVGEEITRIAGTARVVASMRAGMRPAAACREAVRHIAQLRGDAVKDAQVAFLAIDTRGEVGGYALQPGFTFAVTDPEGRTEVRAAESLKGPRGAK
ncbi:N(4)-(beta-N-acetylglucosaminyl)-L-asparaginase [Sphingomonas psychrotolerans]|uniref:N(4)-(Beta-N-acetylglucosaminyl)-L-asparaginase n=1 Tax=Sphingomonas psychrotolerans TaxID=1327635 RepID=A0A2K8MI92_9SPHN|nr:N(4)-(beta-N-acetylglucosaminyl)-L-asparaginase [Sphingomonas psychrotolerans]ATY32714.1 N(4)-(beta-N-acetylglucosaminyl)-L-asparaginase [Sphingomonas psychrotolerans]